ncbi:TKL protein kinase [Saprolegnia parasitica CBS 223.65]|uniref:TKL protein kinase n=1 Tax=Saprolegnia parasitica (strain CBS 223.65) TaxID=695850 RepID=A0A067D4N4_SAPPC|nr:TKL protein kinase [Saprolegnia parasitica CBS 223.65]KDO33982.1 TKL protein kinase [Saprolegnia parasitica CBS 223.65]|eukprot:XP_012194870.1 TKL protein kinase [Saprolegnia parasitica CBS 223.65]
MLRGLLLLLWLSLAAASKCDTMYTRPGISTLVADGSCPASVACLLDAQCKPIQSFPNATTTFSDPLGASNLSIGDLSKYPHPTLKLYNLRYGNAFDRVEFPPTLQNLTMDHLTLYSLGSLQLPAGLKNWTMFTCYVSKITTPGFQWPQSLETLNLNENHLTDVPANIPRSVKYLDLAFNNISVVVNQDWRSLRYLYLSGIQTFAHVWLSTNLTYFSCSGSHITNLTLDEDTYRVLNALGPNNYTSNTGVNVGWASANASTCTGRILPIWQGVVENATACVVPTVTSPPPTTFVPTDGAASGGSSGLLIAVLVASGVVVLSAIVLVLYRRQQHSLSIQESTTSTIDLSNLQMFKLDRSELVVLGDKPLAAGAFGEVWKGTYANEVVAIKRNKDKLEKGLQSFIAEITLMAKMDSPYIVRLVGASWVRPVDIECVVEFMDLGDLRCFLADHSMTQFTWSEKAPVVRSIVFGLIFLHTFDPPIVHRDLKSRNILLDSVKGTKLTDFGISREVDDLMTNGIGTYQWMAPEIISGTSYSEAADIYSFGVVLSELSTHAIPYLGLTNSATGRSATPQFVMTKVLAGEMTPAFDATSPSWVQEIGLRCMALDPDARPTALELYVLLRPLLDSLPQTAKSTSP